ncbi:hypothetical protein HYQ45_000135 [Verticillium longisporum]|uniref:Uncharacterized protein n=1 Tax=Verticillium longisporum TaxID=100787 RepID=A0A8I3A4Y4_VERLO|nr:hypothetical protein HYQ45_000135 [Verticillium longisporum]
MSGAPYTIPYSGSRAKGPEDGYAPDSAAPGSTSSGYKAAGSGYKQPVVASDAPAASNAHCTGQHSKGNTYGTPHSSALCHPKYANSGSSYCIYDDSPGKGETVHHVTPVSSPKKKSTAKNGNGPKTYDGVCDEEDVVPDLAPFNKELGSRLLYPCGNCHLFILYLKRKPDFCDVCRMIPDCKDCGRDYPEMGGQGVRRPSIGFTFPNGNVATYDAPKPEFPFDLVSNYNFGQSK